MQALLLPKPGAVRLHHQLNVTVANTPSKECATRDFDMTLALGRKGSGLAFHFHEDGFNELFHGRKRWFFYSPLQTPRFNPRRTQASAHLSSKCTRCRAEGRTRAAPGQRIVPTRHAVHAPVVPAVFAVVAVFAVFAVFAVVAWVCARRQHLGLGVRPSLGVPSVPCTPREGSVVAPLPWVARGPLNSPRVCVARTAGPSACAWCAAGALAEARVPDPGGC